MSGVAELQREKLRLVGGLRDEHHVGGDVGGRPVGTHEAECAGAHRTGPVEHAVGVDLEGREVVGMQQRLEREADQRSWPTRHQITEGGVGSSDATVASDDRHAHGAQLEAHAQLVLALDERLLRSVAIGDVTSDSETCPPPFELDGLRRHLDPQLGAALGAMQPLPRQRRPRPGTTEPREQHRHVGRVEKVGDAHGAEFGLRPSVLRDRLVVHCEERERVEVVDPHRIG